MEKWKSYCLGSEGYQVRRDISGLTAPEVKTKIRKEDFRPIVESLGGGFQIQKVTSELIASLPDLYDSCRIFQVGLTVWLRDPDKSPVTLTTIFKYTIEEVLARNLDTKRMEEVRKGRVD